MRFATSGSGCIHMRMTSDSRPDHWRVEILFDAISIAATNLRVSLIRISEKNDVIVALLINLFPL